MRAPSAYPFSERLSRQVYESLQGRPEVGPLPTPRRCHRVREHTTRLRRCEPRYHLDIAA